MTARLIAKQLRACFDRGNKVLICGNGGSAQQANHFAAELIHEQFPAISLTSDISVITSIANDFSYKEVFARQIIALGKENDIVVGFTTSGNSENILYAYQWALKMNLEVIDFPRRGPTPHCQEYQLKLLHQVWQFLKQ